MPVNTESLPTIHPDDVVVGRSIKNIRKTYSESEIEELGRSLLDHGLLNPITLLQTEDENGNPIWELVAGSRRLRAIQLVRATIEPTFYDDVPFIPYEGEINDAVFANAVENIDRSDLNTVDVCEWLKERTDDGLEKADLAKRFSKTVSWVDQRLFFIQNATAALVAALRAGQIAFSTAYELAKKTKADQERFLNQNGKWLEKVTAEDVKVDQDPEGRTKRPTKKAIEKALDRIKGTAADQPDNLELQGMEFALRWVVGLMEDSEFEQAVSAAIGEVPETVEAEAEAPAKKTRKKKDATATPAP